MSDLNILSSITMTSREIAELTGKRHDHVLRDIRNMIASLNHDFVNGFKLSTYIDAQDKERDQFELTADTANLLLDKYKGLARVPHRMQEEAALKTIEQILGIVLIRQYKVCGYRIDGYCVETNTAYEIDEPDHKHKRKEDGDRQRQIEQILGCSFVRILL